jgi:hypothetical protein
LNSTWYACHGDGEQSHRLSEKYTNILMGTVQAASLTVPTVRRRHPGTQGERPGDHHRVWPARASLCRDDHKGLFNMREASQAIHKAMHHETSIGWL